jgi:DNA-binding CsgD family transcriptional regulator
MGEFDTARTTLEEAIQASREVGEPSTFATAVMFLCGTLCSVGDYGDARSLGEEALTELRRFYGLLVPEGALIGVGNTETIEGRPEQGLAVLEEVLATVRAEGIASTTSYVAGLAAVAARHLGDADRAAELAAESRAVGENLKSPSAAASARHIAGLIAFDRGDLEVADGELHAALIVRVELGWRPEVVDSLEALAAVAAVHESDQEAVRLLGAAASARRAIGYQRYPVDEPAWQRTMAAVRLRLGDDAFEAAWAEGEALDLDAAATYASRARGERGRPSIGWASLTPTEIEVVRLAAQGLTNPEIGERLFISRGTVKTHLAHVFAKVGVANRSELAAEVARRDL